jgi:hypothetical protein
VITGRFEDHLAGGADDVLTAELIERARTGHPLEAKTTAAALLATEEAAKTLALGSEHSDPRDIELAADVDRSTSRWRSNAPTVVSGCRRARVADGQLLSRWGCRRGR